MMQRLSIMDIAKMKSVVRGGGNPEYKPQNLRRFVRPVGSSAWLTETLVDFQVQF